MKKTVCIGSVTTDILISPVDNLPAPGVLQSISGLNILVGGCAANAAIDMSKIGVPSKLVCKIGTDALGALVKKSVEDTGIDTKGLIIDGNVQTTTSIVCIASNGERSFLYAPASVASMTREEIPMDYLNDCDIVFVSGANLLTSFDGAPCAGFLKEMQQKGKYTVMDTAWDFDDIWLPKVKDSIKYLDLFMPSVEEAEKISGQTEHEKMADFFFELGAKSVIIKLGKSGAYVCENTDKRFISKSFLVKSPKDTTGAGDAFCAGFLSGLAMGKGFEDSAVLANATGAHCVMEVGASTGIKAADEMLSAVLG